MYGSFRGMARTYPLGFVGVEHKSQAFKNLHCSTANILGDSMELIPQSTLQRGKRTMLEIASEILELCRLPRTRTRVMNGANISWNVSEKYLSQLQSQGLMEVTGSPATYATTEQGFALVQKVRRVTALLDCRSQDRTQLPGPKILSVIEKDVHLVDEYSKNQELKRSYLRL
jgi:predicted transcriptional regulator